MSGEEEEPGNNMRQVGLHKPPGRDEFELRVGLDYSKHVKLEEA